MKLNLVLIITILLVQVLTESDANAGILFNNRRQVIRTVQPRFSQQFYNVRTSSAVMQSTNPNLNARSWGGVTDQLKLIKTRYKYDLAVAKWDQKRQQQLEKQLKKKKDFEAREAKRKQREAIRLKKQKEKDDAKVQSVFGQRTQVTSAANNSSRGSLGSTSPQQAGKKKGFWQSLLQAFFGNKENT